MTDHLQPKDLDLKKRLSVRESKTYIIQNLLSSSKFQNKSTTFLCIVVEYELLIFQYVDPKKVPSIQEIKVKDQHRKKTDSITPKTKSQFIPTAVIKTYHTISS